MPIIPVPAGHDRDSPRWWCPPPWSGLALLLTGGVVGLLSGTSPATRGLRQLAIGMGAAGVTYLLGMAFGAVVG